MVANNAPMIVDDAAVRRFRAHPRRAIDLEAQPASAGLLALVAFLLATPASAWIFPPYLIGQASAAAGSATLNLTTTAACQTGALIVMGLSEVGATSPISTAPTDAAANTYTATGSFSGTSIRGVFYKSAPAITKALASGSAVTATFPNSTTAQAAIMLCVPAGVTFGSAADANGTSTSGSSASPAITQAVNAQGNDIAFVLTILAGGAGDTWTEAPGYTSIAAPTALNVNATRLAWAISPGPQPAPYTPTNGASRAWAVNSASFRPSVCTLATLGAGPC